MMQRRNFPRHHMIYYLMVFERETNDLVGFMVDVSKGGMRLTCDTPPEIGTLLHLKMTRARREGETMAGSIEFDAEALWASNTAEPSFYDVGFKILEAPDDMVEQVQEIIDTFSFDTD